MNKQEIEEKIELLKASEEVLNNNILRLKDMLEDNDNVLGDITLKLSELESQLVEIEEQEDIDNANAKLHEEHDDYDDTYQLGN